jgi:hypothetical protein
MAASAAGLWPCGRRGCPHAACVFLDVHFSTEDRRGDSAERQRGWLRFASDIFFAIFLRCASGFAARGRRPGGDGEAGDGEEHAALLLDGVPDLAARGRIIATPLPVFH